jgi:hypothetical protein
LFKKDKASKQFLELPKFTTTGSIENESISKSARAVHKAGEKLLSPILQSQQFKD